MPAIEQPRRHHVERLEILVHEAEGLLEIGKHRSGKLVHEKGTIGIQNRSGLVQDLISDSRMHGCIRDAGNDVVRLTELEIGEGRIGFSRRPVDDV
jgi:hypothetical protein